MQLLDLNLIGPADGQARKTFYDDSLNELAQSIRERGVLEPIVVRPTQGGRYEIVIGERRYRASKMAGLTTIPAIIRELSDEDAAKDALLENFQREDLNPVERAQAIYDLMKFMHWDQCAKTLGVTESTLKRYLELLDLPRSIQGELAVRRSENDGSFWEGHARLLKALSNDEKLIIRRDIAARAHLVKYWLNPIKPGMVIHLGHWMQFVPARIEEVTTGDDWRKPRLTLSLQKELVFKPASRAVVTHLEGGKLRVMGTIELKD